MNRAEYRVLTSAPGQEEAALTDYGASARTEVPCPGGKWTADSASLWAHVEGAKLASGTWIAVQRRTGPRAGWQPHRAYLVETDGIVRRTER